MKHPRRWIGWTTWVVLILCLHDPALALQNKLGCLSNIADPSLLFNLDTESLVDQPIENWYDDLTHIVSPKQDRYAYLIQGEKPPKTQLKIQYIDTQKIKRNVLVHAFDTDLNSLAFRMIWVADGQYLAYVWHEAGSYHLALADSFGDEKQAIDLHRTEKDRLQFISLISSLGLEIVPAEGASIYRFFHIPDLMKLYEFVPILADCQVGCPTSGDFKIYPDHKGRRVALVNSDDYQTTQLFIVTPDTASYLKFSYLSSNLIRAEWSPDDKRIAILTFNGGRGRARLDVFGVDGSILSPADQQIEVPTGSEGYTYPTIHWSTDSQMIFYMQSALAENQTYALPEQRKFIAFRIKDKRSQTLIQDTNWIPDHGDFRSGDKYVLASWNTDGHRFTGVLNAVTGNKVPFVQDGEFAVSFWAANQTLVWVQWQDSQNAKVVWAAPDGSGRHQIDLPGESIEFVPPDSNYHWEYDSPDSKWRLLYTIPIKDPIFVRLVNLQTNKYRLLATSEEPVNTFIAPDSKTVAIDYRQNSIEYLSLLKLNESTSYQITLNEPLQVAAWSPDGSMLAYVTNEAQWLNIISRNGTLIRRIDNNPFGWLPMGSLRWTDCK